MGEKGDVKKVRGRVAGAGKVPCRPRVESLGTVKLSTSKYRPSTLKVPYFPGMPQLGLLLRYPSDHGAPWSKKVEIIAPWSHDTGNTNPQHPYKIDLNDLVPVGRTPEQVGRPWGQSRRVSQITSQITYNSKSVCSIRSLIK